MQVLTSTNGDKFEKQEISQQFYEGKNRTVMIWLAL